MKIKGYFMRYFLTNIIYYLDGNCKRSNGLFHSIWSNFVLRKNEAHLEQQCPRLPSQALSPTWYAMHSQYNVKALIKEWAEFESASRSSPASTTLNSQPAFTCLYIYIVWFEKKNHLIPVYCKNESDYKVLFILDFGIYV